MLRVTVKHDADCVHELFQILSVHLVDEFLLAEGSELAQPSEKPDESWSKSPVSEPCVLVALRDRRQSFELALVWAELMILTPRFRRSSEPVSID
jgi:hypothetical protein